MQGYDIVMLGVMAIAIMRGYSKGLAWQVSSIASIVASYFVAYRFKDRLTPMIELADPWRGLVAMMILFVGTSLVIWFIFHNIRGAIEKAKLKDFDHQLGAIFGGIKGAAWCTAITIAALSFMTPAMSQQIVNSRSGGYIARILASSKRVIPEEVQQVVQPYIQRAEDQLQDRVDQPTPGIAQDWPPTDHWQQTVESWSQPDFTPQNHKAPSVAPQPSLLEPIQPPPETPTARNDGSWFGSRFGDTQNSRQPDPLRKFSNNGQSVQ